MQGQIYGKSPEISVMKSVEFDFSFVRKTRKVEKLMSECSHSHFSSRRLCAITYEDATVLTTGGWTADGRLLGGVVDEDGNYIKNSAYSDGYGGGYEINDSQVDESEETVIYLGFFYPCWGHLITDSLSKFWFLDTEECKKLIEGGAKIIYISNYSANLPKYNIDLFHLAGVEVENYTNVKKITKFKKVIIPDNAFYYEDGNRFYTKEFSKTIEKIKQNASQGIATPSKVYYTKKTKNDPREWGREQDIEVLFKQKGYAIISPEEYDVKRQIQFMMGCEKFAATEGSISHNAIFCNPGTEVAVLRKADYTNGYTIIVGEVSNAKTIYVDANHSTMAFRKIPAAGPFYVCVTSYLRRYLGVCGFWLPFILFYSYWRYFFCVPINWILNKIKQKLK